MPLTITSPLRILFITVGQAHPPSTLSKDHESYEIHTPYYTASIPIWHDDIAASTDAIEAWKKEWMGDDEDAGAGAGEVVKAIGAWICCFSKPKVQGDLDLIRAVLAAVHTAVQHHLSSSYSTTEPIFLALGTRQTSTPALEVTDEEWEGLCADVGGWEWIDGAIDDDEHGDSGERRNEYGERIGLARLKEALEANEWESGDADGDGELGEGGSDDDGGVGFDLGLEGADADIEGDVGGVGGVGFGKEAEEMQKEIWSLKDAVKRGEGKGVDGGEKEEDEEEGGDDEVQVLESMMLKMQAVRDMGADMPEAQRRRFAAEAVRDVMKNL